MFDLTKRKGAYFEGIICDKVALDVNWDIVKVQDFLLLYCKEILLVFAKFNQEEIKFLNKLSILRGLKLSLAPHYCIKSIE